MRRLIDDLLTLAPEGDIIDSTASADLEDAARSAWEMTATEDAGLSLKTDQVIELISTGWSSWLEICIETPSNTVGQRSQLWGLGRRLLCHG